MLPLTPYVSYSSVAHGTDRERYWIMEEQRNPDLQAIFFDLDNTLIATRKADRTTCDKLTNILNEKYSVPPDVASRICRDYLVSFRNCPDNEVLDLDTWRQLLWKEALGEEYKSLAEPIYQQWFQLRLEHLALPQETKTLIKGLRKSYLIALITNGPSSAQWEKIDRLNLRSYFDVILVSGDLPWEKPHHKIFHEACDYLQVHPRSCIIVGDKLETDILGGAEAKLAATIWLPLTKSAVVGPKDPHPDFTIENIMDLRSLIPKISKLMQCSGNHLGLTFDVAISDIEDSNSNSSHCSHS